MRIFATGLLTALDLTLVTSDARSSIAVKTASVRIEPPFATETALTDVQKTTDGRQGLDFSAYATESFVAFRSSCCKMMYKIVTKEMIFVSIGQSRQQ